MLENLLANAVSNCSDNGPDAPLLDWETGTKHEQWDLGRTANAPHSSNTIWRCMNPDRQIRPQAGYLPTMASMAGRVPTLLLERPLPRIATAPRWRGRGALQVPSPGLCGKGCLA